MQDNIENNKRIAKNTIYLYVRTILIMLVTLYMSRVLLQTLGVEDFGVYNAVGGVVSMFAILSGALSNAISRYITYGLFKDDKRRLNVIFCTGLNIQIIISIVVVVLCEIVGVWFLNYKMNIPPDRLFAANWVLQCSLVTFVVNLISVPYNACIIAHEHMNAYAYISILDAVLKLAIVYLFVISPYDKLIVYSLLLVVVSVIIRIVYGLYCRRHFEETIYHLYYDKELFRKMMSFAGWNFFTNGASIINNQGITILINIYFGVLLNTARGIAAQVDSAVTQFVTSFITAVNPQITKTYAQNDKDRMFSLICKGAKFSYLLLLVMAVPIMVETEFVLKLWLKDVPDYSVLFVRLSFLGAMVTTLGNTGYTACMATGKIKKYAIYITTVGCFAFVSTWLLYSLGASVESTYFAYIIVYVFVQVVRLFIMRDLLRFPIMKFVNEVVVKISFTTLLAFILPMLIRNLMAQTFIRFLFVTVASFLWTFTLSYFLSLSSSERSFVRGKLLLILKRKRRN